MSTIFGFLKYGFISAKLQLWYSICLGLDGIVYSFINFLFKLFLILAGTNIFTEDTMVEFIRRIYQLIGVIMLFMLSYALLKKIVNPDSKDKESVGKIVFNVVKAIILLAVVPSLFTYAFKFQNAILKQNTIGKIILGNTNITVDGKTQNASEVINNGGIVMAQGVFEAFLFPTGGDRNTEIADGVTFEQLSSEVSNTGNFQSYKMAAEAVDNNKLTYFWGIALIAGAVVVYMLVSYCISLGFRIIKLAFYEVMAPVCIIASILPSQKEMLSRWIKTTLQVFLETFIRIAILYFVTYLLTVLKGAMASGTILSNAEGILKSLAWVAIILGLVTFMKSAPDLISKLTGMDSGNMSLGIKDQLAKGGFFTAGAIAGGLITSGVRNATGVRNRWKNAKARSEDRRNRIDADAGRSNLSKRVGKAGARISSAFSKAGAVAGIFTGALSGGIHSFNKDAKSFADMKEGAIKGSKEAAANRDARQSRANRYHADGKNIVTGRFTDWKDSVEDWATGGAAQYQEAIDTGKKYGDKYSTITSKTESVREKMKGDTALIEQNGRRLTDTANDALQELRGIFKGDVSIANVEDFAKSLAEPLDRTKYATLEEYDKAMAERLQKASVINNQLLPQLKKYANLDIQDAVINEHYGKDGIYLRGDPSKAVAGFKADKFGEVSSAIEDFKSTFEIMGSRLVEKDKDGKAINTYTEAGTAEQIKNVADAAQNNYNLAVSQSSIYEQKKAARKGEDKK